MRNVLLLSGVLAVCSISLACDSASAPASDASAANPCRQPVGRQGDAAHVLRFESVAPGVRVHISRRSSGTGVGESVLYELLGMWIERDGACTAITEKPQLRYENSHHNWRDRAFGRDGALEYQVQIDFEVDDRGRRWSSSVSAGEALPTTPLVVTGGPLADFTAPNFLPVYVSELMPDNRTFLQDEGGDHEPWIELFNPSAGPVDLGGYSLSNDPEQRRRWTFSNGTIIGRHQHMIVFADGQPGQGARHANFRLSPAGGHIVLTGPTGVTGGERSYPALSADKSAAYTPERDRFEPSSVASPGGGASQ